jgi:hypothetical protein
MNKHEIILNYIKKRNPSKIEDLYLYFKTFYGIDVENYLTDLQAEGKILIDHKFSLIHIKEQTPEKPKRKRRSRKK